MNNVISVDISKKFYGVNYSTIIFKYTKKFSNTNNFNPRNRKKICIARDNKRKFTCFHIPTKIYFIGGAFKYILLRFSKIK